MMTVKQAANALGMSRQRVHYLIKQGRINATRYGYIWMVKEATVKAAKKPAVAR